MSLHSFLGEGERNSLHVKMFSPAGDANVNQ